MKKNTTRKPFLTSVIILLSTGCFAQFQITTGTSSEFMGTNGAIRGVGIGNFPNSQITDAALHVNTKYMTASSNYPGIDFGEVFRTDAPNAATYWKMFRDGDEIARYWNGGTNNELNIGTIQTSSNPHLNFFTANTPKATILANGNVGIGTTAPAAVLHLQRGTNTLVASRYTNPNAVGINGNEGFEVGVEANGTGVLRHMNDLDIEVRMGNFRSAFFTHTNFYNAAGTQGTGLRICDPDANPGGDLDLWTSNSNQTHIVWGPNGRIFGRNERFEIQADFTDGLWFNVANPATRTYFNTQGSENARIGPTGLWRIGPNTTNADPANTLDVNGTAGIRTVTSNPALTKVLVWNDGNNGLIQFRDLSTLGTVGTCNPTTQNYLSRWCSNTNQLQNSIVYDNGQTVGISVPGLTPVPAAKLDVRNSVSNIGTNTLTTTTSQIFNLGMFGSAQNGLLVNAGLLGHSPSFISFAGVAPPVNLTLGVTTIAIPFNAGVIGRAQNANFNFGGIFEANNVQGCPGVNIGVYASAKKTCHPVPGIAGYFNGDIFYTGSPQYVSDIQLKDSIVEFRNSLNVLKKLALKKYVFKTASYPYMNLPEGTNYGFISQQVDTILPELTSEVLTPPVLDTAGIVLQDTTRIKTLNYVGLIPLAIGAIQELKAITDSLGLHKAQVCSLPTDSNRLSKWSSTTGRLCSSLVYDNGQQVGIPNVDAEALFHVQADSGYAATFVSDSGIAATFQGTLHGLTAFAEGKQEATIGLRSGAKGGTDRNIGVDGYALHPIGEEGINIGVKGQADSSDYVNNGVYGFVVAETESAINVGVIGIGNNSQNQNMGGYFQTDGNIKTDIALYAVNLGGHLAGYFDGDVVVTGTLTSSSDAALKQNVQAMQPSDALGKLALLEPKTYDFLDSGTVTMNLPRGPQYGFLAQDVEQVLPGLVKEVVHPQRLSNDGHIVSEQFAYKAINYTGLIPLLVSAVKDQQTKIDSLQQVIDNRLSAIEQRLNNCCERGALPTDGAFKDQPAVLSLPKDDLEL